MTVETRKGGGGLGKGLAALIPVAPSGVSPAKGIKISSTPFSVSPGLRWSRIRSIVAVNCPRPSNAVSGALKRNEHTVRGGQCIDGQQAERGRTV